MEYYTFESSKTLLNLNMTDIILGVSEGGQYDANS